jgi:hypothetical protein
LRRDETVEPRRRPEAFWPYSALCHLRTDLNPKVIGETKALVETVEETMETREKATARR